MISEFTFNGEFKTSREPGKTYKCQVFKPSLLSFAIAEHYPDRVNHFAVNIGAGDGFSCNDPVYPLFDKGYSGLALEGSENPALFSNLASKKITKLTGIIVTPNNIEEILKQNNCPIDCDFLKIDVDGYDGPILRQILDSGFRPKIIQIEINPEIPPPISFSVLFDENYRCFDSNGNVGGFYGASMSNILNIVRPYSYKLAQIDFITPWTHDLTLINENFDSVLVHFPPICPLSDEREIYLSHPPPHSHFMENGINSLSWRYRNDFLPLVEEIRSACSLANKFKHGTDHVLFELSSKFSQA